MEQAKLLLSKCLLKQERKIRNKPNKPNKSNNQKRKIKTLK
jgi:hypothetical protein